MVKCFNHVQQTPRFFPRFLKSKKSILIYLNTKYIEVSNLLRSQLIVCYFLIKLKFYTCSILPTIFENFLFSLLLSENYEIKKPKRVKANFFDYGLWIMDQWRIQHFPWGEGALTYISGKVFTKSFMTTKQKLVLRRERLCLEPPKIHQCLLPKLSVQNLCLTVIAQFTFFFPEN